MNDKLKTILFDILMTPVYVVTNVIGVIMLILTIPIWGIAWLRWVTGKGSMRDWYNTIMKCALVTWTMTDNEYYGDFIDGLCNSQFKKVNKIENKLKRAVDEWLYLAEEKDSIE